VSEARGIEADVTFPEPNEALLDAAEGAAVLQEDGYWPTLPGVPVWDFSDPLSGQVYLTYLSQDGTAAILCAPDLQANHDGVCELERRIVRDVAGDYDIRDWRAADSPRSLAGVRASETLTSSEVDRAEALVISPAEVEALRALLSDSELYVDDGQGGWIPPQVERDVLAPLRARLAAIPVPEAEPPRTVLVHLNVEVPAADFAGCGPEALMRALEIEVRDALEVGTDAEQTPVLSASAVVVALVDEV